MSFTIGTATFTNGSKNVTNVSLTSGKTSYFARGTRVVVGANPVLAEVEATNAPTNSTFTLTQAWPHATGSYAFLANMTSEGVRDAVQTIRTYVDGLSVAPSADTTVVRTSTGAVRAANGVNADEAVVVGQTGTAYSRDVGTAAGNVAEYSDRGLSGYGYGGSYAVLTSASIVPACGFFAMSGTVSPFGSDRVKLINIASPEVEGIQIAASDITNRIFYRAAENGAWKQPVEIWHSGNLPSPATTDTAQTISGEKTFTAGSLWLGDEASTDYKEMGVKRNGRQARLRCDTSGAARIGLFDGTTSVEWTCTSSAITASHDVYAPNYYPSASDERLKNKLRPAVINYRQARALQSWVFQWKDHEALPESQRGKIEIGLIAQEVLKVFPPEQYPSLVIKKDDGYYTIDPDKIVMMRLFAKVEPRFITWAKDAKRWLKGEK